MTAYDGNPGHMVCGIPLNDGVTAKLTDISSSQFLSLEGNFEDVATFIASLMYQMDWHLTQRKPAERLEIQRRIDALGGQDDD